MVNADAILGLMMQVRPEHDLNWEDVPVLFAATLANISERVTDEELYTLMALGTLMFDYRILVQSEALADYLASRSQHNKNAT